MHLKANNKNLHTCNQELEMEAHLTIQERDFHARGNILPNQYFNTCQMCFSKNIDAEVLKLFIWMKY